MDDRPIGHGTIYGSESPRDMLQPVSASEQEANERAAQKQRLRHPVDDPALLGFDPYDR